MKKDLEKLLDESLETIKQAKSFKEIEKIEADLFSRKKGKLTELMKGMGSLSVEQKKKIGPLANKTKKKLAAVLGKKKKELAKIALEKQLEEEKIDISAPCLEQQKIGHLHPITQMQRDLEDLFESMGYTIAEGPELESDFFNFEALNIPADHPARDMQDTFYIKDQPNLVMRTHTSSVQVRTLKKYGAPLRAITVGRCFRNEATDARHEHTFFQLEGLVVDSGISFAHLKGVLKTIAQHLYGPETKVRLRPKFYPFVEPGVNGEVTCMLCKGKGCRVCKYSGWMEIFGAGMVHPHVLEAGGVDPEKMTGFAFGFGVNRLVMLKYNIEDIRHFMSGDLRFLEQF